MANDFLVFAGGAGANVLSQTDWAALTARTSGFSSGVAQSAQLNKAWRQSSIMAAVLAQFISDRTGLDVLDDGTTATILANLKASAAAVNGDATKTFSVAAASAAAHATRYDQVFGVGQTLQSVTGSRALNTNYTNTGSKPIYIGVQVNLAVGQGFALTVSGVAVTNCGNAGSGQTGYTACWVVMPGQTYQATVSGASTLLGWYEIR